MLSTLIFLYASAIPQSTDYAAEWGQIRSAITRSYYARQSRAIEMNRLLDSYGPKIESSKTHDEFISNIDGMIAAFGDSHFSYYTRSDQGWYLMDALAKGDKAALMPNIGAWFCKTPEGYEVQMVLDGLPAMDAGIRKGDVIEQAGDRPFGPIDSFRGSIGSTVNLTIRRGETTLTKNVEVKSATALGMFLDATRNSERVIDDHGKKIAYMHLWTMAGDEFREALSGAVYGKFDKTDGFILDIRDGFGGRPEGYGDPFFRPDVNITWVTGSSRSYESFGYGRPLVTIINGGSRSAKELFSFVLKKSHRATLIGSNTAGNVLGTTPYRLPSGDYFEIPIADVFADGTRIEGKGVAPDVAVPHEFDANGDDMDLQAALEKLKSIPTQNTVAKT